MNSMKISIVTVTYNCETMIEDTIKSVVTQSYQNKEYVIIDGGSSDNTINIINRYRNDIDIIISEPDKGIFDAMNKALSKTTGDYVIFINAGDRFASNEIISSVFDTDTFIDEDLIYGDVYYETIAGLKLSKAHSIYEKKYSLYDLVFKAQGFSHQSLFTKTNILKSIGFDLNYPIGADYYATYLVFRKGNHKLKYVEQPIAIFNAIKDGASHSSNFQREIYDERAQMFGLKRGVLYESIIFFLKTVYTMKKKMESIAPNLVRSLKMIKYRRINKCQKSQ